MVVALIVVTTILVFVVVDLLLRVLLTRVREARTRKERELALNIGLKLDVSEEAKTLKRVELADSRPGRGALAGLRSVARAAAENPLELAGIARTSPGAGGGPDTHQNQSGLPAARTRIPT